MPRRGNRASIGRYARRSRRYRSSETSPDRPAWPSRLAMAMRVDQDWFPMIDTAANGGHIYQWTLGFHVSAFDVARKHGHGEVLDLLLKCAGPLDQLLDALWCSHDARADAVLA